jgi:hypothetical protein
MPSSAVVATLIADPLSMRFSDAQIARLKQGVGGFSTTPASPPCSTRRGFHARISSRDAVRQSGGRRHREEPEGRRGDPGAVECGFRNPLHH